jgi:6-phosphogluconolactonase
VAVLTPDVRIYRDPEALSHAAAALFAETAAQAVSERGRFLVSLNGGGTPTRLYELLAQSPYRQQIDWLRLHAYWGDERCVPPEDLQNNFRQARETLLGRVPVPPEHAHRVRTEFDPQSAAEDYARVLRLGATPPLEWPRFDLVLLGLGEDGHTASIFPGSETEVSVPTLAVRAEYQHRLSWRVTLTPPVFNSARRIVFLVSGAGKSKIVSRVLYGEFRPAELPAQRIQPTDGELIWMLDTGAAANQ